MGITGYRLFPRDASMTPDSVGTRDIFAILVSKKELDWNAFQKAVNRQPSSLPWPVKVKTALPGGAAKNVNFITTPKGNIGFTAQATDHEVVYCIVEFDKQ